MSIVLNQQSSSDVFVGFKQIEMLGFGGTSSISLIGAIFALVSSAFIVFIAFW